MTDEQNKERCRKIMRELRNRRKENGECVCCGVKLNDGHTKKSCDTCSGGYNAYVHSVKQAVMSGDETVVNRSHGTISMYAAGCRCERCAEARKTYMKKYRGKVS